MILGCVRELSTTSLIATFHGESFGLIARVVLKNVSEKAFIKFGFNFRESFQN